MNQQSGLERNESLICFFHIILCVFLKTLRQGLPLLSENPASLSYTSPTSLLEHQSTWCYFYCMNTNQYSSIISAEIRIL